MNQEWKIAGRIQDNHWWTGSITDEILMAATDKAIKIHGKVVEMDGDGEFLIAQPDKKFQFSTVLKEDVVVEWSMTDTKIEISLLDTKEQVQTFSLENWVLTQIACASAGKKENAQAPFGDIEGLPFYEALKNYNLFLLKTMRFRRMIQKVIKNNNCTLLMLLARPCVVIEHDDQIAIYCAGFKFVFVADKYGDKTLKDIVKSQNALRSIESKYHCFPLSDTVEVGAQGCFKEHCEQVLLKMPKRKLGFHAKAG